MQDKLEVCIKDWAELADEYKDLELAHKDYRNVGIFYRNEFLQCYTILGLGQMFVPSEEMYFRRDSPEVPAGSDQEAGGRGGHHHHGGAGRGAGPQQGHPQTDGSARADVREPTEEEWQISERNHWEC